MNKINRTILLIDDDLPLLLGLKTLLERSGYHVIARENSADGIKQAEKSQHDLIVCDVMMPKMDGYKVHEAMSANPLTHNIPFLFLSARASQEDKLKGFEDGADDYITKPFDIEELKLRVQGAIRRS